MSHNFAMYPSLRDRTVVVTGGASGIGESIVSAFAYQGARVAFLDVERDLGEALVARLASGSPHHPLFERCDLTDCSQLQVSLNKILEAFGTIDILVNNAGNDTRHSLDDITPEFWDRVMSINLKQQFFTAKALIPGMRKSGWGAIINMSSIGWLIPSTRQLVYVTAKAAIVGMTRTMAHELGVNNIRVNCVLPGAVLTERQKHLWFTEEYKAEILAAQALKRLILPEEVARLCLFLASDDSSAITNQSYIVDGGWI